MMTSINSPKFPSLSKDFPKHESSYISSFKSPQQCNKRLPTAYSCYIHLPLYAILCHMLCPQGTRRAQSAGSAQCGWLAPNTLPAQAWWKSDSQRHTDYAYLGLTGQFSRKAVEMLYYIRMFISLIIRTRPQEAKLQPPTTKLFSRPESNSPILSWNLNSVPQLSTPWFAVLRIRFPIQNGRQQTYMALLCDIMWPCFLWQSVLCTQL